MTSQSREFLDRRNFGGAHKSVQTPRRIKEEEEEEEEEMEEEEAVGGGGEEEEKERHERKVLEA